MKVPYAFAAAVAAICLPATRLAAYLWHPLPLWEIANSGHIDALMVALMMLGLWLALTARPLLGVLAISLGALAKPLALLALPAIWRPWNWKMPLTAAGLALPQVLLPSVDIRISLESRPSCIPDGENTS